MNDIKLNNKTNVAFGNTARDVILYKRVKELAGDLKEFAVDVENKLTDYALKTDLDSKVDKVNEVNKVYVTDESGNQQIINYTSESQANSIVKRDENSTFELSSPTSDNNPATKKYVDTSVTTLKDAVAENYAEKTYVNQGLSNKANLNDVYDKTTSDARYLPIYPYTILAKGKSKATIKNALNKIEYPDVTREIVAWSIIQRDDNGRAQIADPGESNDIANKHYVDNSISSAISRVYKPQGTVTVDILNSLTITKEMNGYVYDISGTGTLTKGSVQVTQGDNVAIIWNENETDWKWDKLSSVVDLSNYATKTYVNQGLNSKVDLSSDQTITGVKRFSNTVYIGNYDNDYISITNGDLSIRATNSLVLRSGNNNIIPYTNNSIDLGSSTSKWKDLYLSGKVDFGTKIEGRVNTSYITTDNYDGVGIYVNGIRPINIYDNGIYLAKPILPNTTTIDIGGTDKTFRDLYLSGNAYASSYTAKNSSTNINWGISSNQYSNMQFERNSAGIFSMSSQAFFPNSDNQRDLGTNDLKFRDAYISRNLTDGTNTIAVANIPSKEYVDNAIEQAITNVLTEEF